MRALTLNLEQEGVPLNNIDPRVEIRLQEIKIEELKLTISLLEEEIVLLREMTQENARLDLRMRIADSIRKFAARFNWLPKPIKRVAETILSFLRLI